MARDNLLKEFESNHTYYFITFFSKFEFFIMQYSVRSHQEHSNHKALHNEGPLSSFLTPI